MTSLDDLESKIEAKKRLIKAQKEKAKGIVGKILFILENDYKIVDHTIINQIEVQNKKELKLFSDDYKTTELKKTIHEIKNDIIINEFNQENLVDTIFSKFEAISIVNAYQIRSYYIGSNEEELLMNQSEMNVLDKSAKLLSICLIGANISKKDMIIIYYNPNKNIEEKINKIYLELQPKVEKYDKEIELLNLTEAAKLLGIKE
jgi:hypothetical protein